MKRWMKWIGIAFLVPLALILLLSVLLYFPPIQDFARNKIVAYASTSTGIDIRIAKVRLSFPLNLTIQDVLALRTPADTLLKLQSLEVRVKLLPLLKSKVVVDAVDLKGGQIHSGDFIEGLQIDGQLGRFHAKADHIDLAKEMATLNTMELSDTQLSIRMNSVAEEKDSTSAPLNWKIVLDEVVLNKVNLDIQLPGDTVRMRGGMNHALLSKGWIDLGRSGYSARKIQLTEGTFSLDNDTLGRKPGLDPNHIAIDSLEFEADSLSFEDKVFGINIRRFSFSEQSGLKLSSLEGSILSDGKQLEIPNLQLKTPYSEMQLLVSAPWSSLDEKAEGSIRSLLIASIGKGDLMLAAGDLPKDFKTYYPNRPVSVTAGIEGNLDKLELRGFKAELAGAFKMDATGTLIQIADSLQRQGSFRIDARSYNLEFILGMLDKKQRDMLELPYGMELKGEVSFKKDAYKTNLTFKEDKALVKLDGSYQSQSEDYQISVSIDSLQPNHFMPKDSLYWLTASAAIKGKGFDLYSARTSSLLQATISDIKYGRNSVSEIQLNGRLKNHAYELQLESGYPLALLKASVSGILQRKKAEMNLDAQVEHLNLYRLHLVDVPLSTAFRFEANASSNLNEILHLTGRLTQWELSGEEKTYYPQDTRFEAGTTRDSTYFEITAGDAFMKLNSDQGATKLSASLSLITDRLMKQYEQQELDLTVLRPLLPNVNIQGFIGKQNPIQDLLALQKIKFNEASFTAATSPAQGLSVNMAMHKFQQDTLMVDTLRIESFEDTSGLKLKGEVKLNRTRWRKAYNGILDGHIRKNEVNALVHVTDGDGKIGLHLGTEARLEKEGFISARLYPDNPIIAFRRFTLNEDNYLRYKDLKNMSANLRLTGEQNASIWLHSVPDSGALKEMHAEISQLDLSLLSADIPNFPSMRGIVSADIQYAPSDNTFMLIADAGIDELFYENKRVGEMQLSAVYLPLSENSHQVDIHFLRDRKEISSATAFYQAGVRDSVSGAINITDFPLEMVNPFIPDGMARMQGFLQGNLDIKGRASDPRAAGFLQMDSASVFVVAAGSTYRFDNKKLEIENNKLLFSNYNLYAYGKNPFVINGDINFSDPARVLANLKLNADNLQLVDVKRNKESLVYGKLFVNLNSTLRGPLDAITMRGNLQLLGNTDLTYVLKDSPLTVQDRLSDLVTFTSFTDTLYTDRMEEIPPLQLGGMDMLLTIHIDPAVRLQADLSADQESRIELEGGGDLYFQYTPQGDMFLNGRYTLSGGSILYTLPVIPKKKFTIKEDSYVEWNGDPMNPVLNLQATERVRTAVTLNEQTPRQVNFDVGISLKQRMSDMQLEFTLNAPEDLTMQNQLSAMGEEERSKQAVSMLVTGMYLGSGSGTGKVNMNMGAALNSFLQKEITNLAGSALKTVDISLGVESSEEETGEKRTDYSFRFAKRFYNDRIRVVLGGRISTGNVPEQNQTFIDNISFEYRLDNSGTRYVKLFHNKNYESILEGEITETGAGIVLRRKMKHIGEFFIFRKPKKITPVNENNANDESNQ